MRASRVITFTLFSIVFSMFVNQISYGGELDIDSNIDPNANTGELQQEPDPMNHSYHYDSSSDNNEIKTRKSYGSNGRSPASASSRSDSESKNRNEKYPGDPFDNSNLLELDPEPSAPSKSARSDSNTSSNQKGNRETASNSQLLESEKYETHLPSEPPTPVAGKVPGADDDESSKKTTGDKLHHGKRHRK